MQSLNWQMLGAGACVAGAGAWLVWRGVQFVRRAQSPKSGCETCGGCGAAAQGPVVHQLAPPRDNPAFDDKA